MSDPVDVQATRGETVRIVVYIADGKKVPIDLTGATGLLAQLRAAPGGALLAEGTVTLSDPTVGEVSIVFASNTASVSGLYDGWLTFPSGDRRRFVHGRIDYLAPISVPS